MSTSRKSIMFIAGDPSGDEHASHVVARLAKERPGLECFGIGGPLMQAAGFRALMPFEPFNRMGVGEVLSSLGFFVRAKKRLVEEMRARRPTVLVLVDYAGFNIPMMKAARAMGIAVLWYITPKVWAWKRGRARTLGTHASTIAVILPFEPPYFEGYGAKVVYVGNPCVENLEKKYGIVSSPKARTGPAGEGKKWRIALVPGSRRQEIVKVLPSMTEAAVLVRERHPVDFRVSMRHGLDKALFSPYLDERALAAHTGPLDELLAWADLALVTSGTATLEAALMGVPHVLVYKMSLVNHAALKTVVRIPFIGLPNIIAGRQIIRECLQSGAKPRALADEIGRFIEEPRLYKETVGELGRLKKALGDRRPSEEVARLVLELFDAATG